MQARDAGRETAFGEATPLSAWIDAGMRRLRPGGRFTLIQRADRLPDLLAAFSGLQAALTLLPIAPRRGREATLAILAAVKGGRAPFRLLPPLILHDGPAHPQDGKDYAPPVRAVLRDAAPLPDWPH
jgi:tRNA1(Val) A37 N6-methylase TrmN6